MDLPADAIESYLARPTHGPDRRKLTAAEQRAMAERDEAVQMLRQAQENGARYAVDMMAARAQGADAFAELESLRSLARRCLFGVCVTGAAAVLQAAVLLAR